MFSDYQTNLPRHEDERKAQVRSWAAAISPEELKTLGGGIGRRFWHRREGDMVKYPLPPNAVAWNHIMVGPNGEPLEEKDWLLKEVETGTDGPIRAVYSYRTNVQIPGMPLLGMRHRYRLILQRSRQFALDARKIAAACYHEDRLWLAQVILERIHPMPAELREMIYQHIRPGPEPDLYVEKLDLADVYRPFPAYMKEAASTRCRSCTEKAAKDVTKNRKRSCPQKTIVVWNFPLRAFMSFHLVSGCKDTQDAVYVPCKYRDCHETGAHHETAEWEMSQDVDTDLSELMTSLIRQRHGPDATLGSIGLGPIDDIVLTDYVLDRRRQDRLFNRHREWQDKNNEWGWKGIGGLLDAMVHGASLRGTISHAANLGVNPYLIPVRTGASWMYGLKKSDEDVVRQVFLRHGRLPRRHCQLCD